MDGATRSLEVLLNHAVQDCLFGLVAAIYFVALARTVLANRRPMP
jgi:hypothetical protein